MLEAFWLHLIDQNFTKWCMFEAFVAGGSFAFWIMLYRTMDQITWFQKYRFSNKPALPVFRENANNAWTPLVIYLLLIRIYHWIIVKPTFSLESPTAIRLLFQVLEGILYYDFIFFWIHLLMHKTPQYSWFFQHQTHHNQVLLCANEVQHHSFVDGSLQVIVNIVIQNLSIYAYYYSASKRKHFLSRLIHNVVITYMLTETHAGYNGFWCLHNLFPNIIGGARTHELHHTSFNNNKCYQPFFMYLDQLYEFMFKRNLFKQYICKYINDKK